ncbi:lipopolysaccharide biosynthesis protein [Microbacterium paludicola]
MITLVVLARLLIPSEIGVVAMVTAIVGVGELVRDLGLSNASIQAKDLSTPQRDNLFWISSSLGVVIGSSVALGSSLIAMLYGEVALQGVALALASTFVFNGLAAQHKASLARSLRFRALAVVETAPPIVASVLAIVLAATGWSFWALVMQQICQALLALVMVVVAARWMPGLPRRTDGMRPLVSYGAHLLGAQMVAYLSRNIDTIVSGVRFGPASTGLYVRAFDLIINPLNQISAPSTRVAMPILSKLQSDEDRYNAFLVRGQKIMLIVVVPALTAAIALADPLITLVLGENWTKAIPIFQILAFAGIIRVCGYPTYWVALSRGATKISLYVNLVSTPVFVVGIILGSMLGIEGIALGFTIGTIATWVISLIWYRRAAAAPSRLLLLSALQMIAATVPATSVAWFAVELSSRWGAIAALAIGAAAYLAVYALTVFVVKPLREDLRTALSTVKLIRKR